jgi:WD40 repeat protein
MCLAISGGTLFSGGYDFAVKAWDIETRQSVGELGGHTQVPPTPKSSCNHVLVLYRGEAAYAQESVGGIPAFAVPKPETPGPNFPKNLAKAPSPNSPSHKNVPFSPKHLQVVTDLVATTRQRPPAPEESSPTKRRKDEPEPDQDIRVILSCAEDMTIRVWDAFSMDCLQVLRLSTPSGVSATGLPLAGCECRPWCMCVDADGLLYLGTREGQIQV